MSNSVVIAQIWLAATMLKADFPHWAFLVLCALSMAAMFAEMLRDYYARKLSELKKGTP